MKKSSQRDIRKFLTGTLVVAWLSLFIGSEFVPYGLVGVDGFFLSSWNRQFRSSLYPPSRFQSASNLLVLNQANQEPSVRPSRNFVDNLLHEHGYAQRLVTVSTSQLPLTAELFSHGRLEFCQILSFQPSKTVNSPPLVNVSLFTDQNDVQLVDLGQITTVWEGAEVERLSQKWQTEVRAELDRFPAKHGDNCMQRLYNSVVQGNKAQSSGAGLTKKRLSSIVANLPDDSYSHVEGLLRKVFKTGKAMSRLVDSSISMDYLYGDFPKGHVEATRRQMVGAVVLADDASLGGRFKRMGCAFVSSTCDENGEISKIAFINGGWLAVDQSVRVGTEARKFAKRSASSPRTKKYLLRTVADERIAQRLECLAMGEAFSGESKQDWNTRDEYQRLEHDVRATLKEMNLPTTPEGAKNALIRIGRWSSGSGRLKMEPWRKEVLGAARSYAEFDRARRQSLSQSAVLGHGDTLEGRLNLTKFPSLCIDAKRTSFRDDAIGIRPRSSTGRQVLDQASKWEILVHITDVSDIYSPSVRLPCGQEVVRLLRDAACSRGESRYDLPLGPLHLLPPRALGALSLDTVGMDTWILNPARMQTSSINRCVTLWAYIDERDGTLLDAGVERSLVQSPLALDFAGSTSLLESDVDSEVQKRARAILAVAERNLLLWNGKYQKHDEVAKQREARLLARERVANEQYYSITRDDGRSGFQRTRGHRLVDAALHLYGIAVTGLLRKKKAPVPWVSGSGLSRGGRVGTAPLRRFIDGVAQRQTLSVLCDYGGPPMNKEECIGLGKLATQAKNKLNNVSSMIRGDCTGRIDVGQIRAVRLLHAQLSGRNQLLQAISSGHENEVIVSGVGAVAKCDGIKGTIRPGKRITVRVKKIDSARGILSVELVGERKE